MRLERLKIKDFRNLRDFEIRFTGAASDADGTERRLKSHAVIGQNGSGKSNMIKAIVTIFRDLDLNQKTGFAYELDYSCRGHRIGIEAMEEKGRVSITERDADKTRDFALSHLQRYAKKFLPSHVFAYYSGRNERIEALFQQHQQRFYDALPQERRRVWQKVSLEIEGYLDAKSKFRPGINPAPKEKMEERLRQIKALTRPDAELSTVALWCVRFRNDDQLLRLVS